VQQLYEKGFAPKTRILALQRDLAKLDADREARAAAAELVATAESRA